MTTSVGWFIYAIYGISSKFRTEQCNSYQRTIYYTTNLHEEKKYALSVYQSVRLACLWLVLSVCIFALTLCLIAFFLLIILLDSLICPGTKPITWPIILLVSTYL